MNHESIIINEHLTLAQLQPQQAEELFKLVDSNREYLGEFLTWVAHIKSADDTGKHIAETIENRVNQSSFTYGVMYDNKIVGDISLKHLNDATRPPEIGYWISSAYAGKGLTSRCARAITELGLDSLDLNKVIIRAEPGNIGSNKVAEKIGYVLADKEMQDGKLLNIWTTKS